jgi:hypothetical protein
MKNLICYEDFVYDKRLKNKNEIILTEGGSYGHMDHPFENNELTFGDMKEICNLTINGLFTTDHMVAEKTDGQNLMVSWKDGQLIASRNTTHRKNRGEKALTKDTIAGHLSEDRPDEMGKAWRDAMIDLENALSYYYTCIPCFHPDNMYVSRAKHKTNVIAEELGKETRV